MWKLYPGSDVFMADLNGKIVGQLTNSLGYDAEETAVFNGSKIIYTSIMSGDLEIWSMDKDGLNKNQLTDRLGYDGGAFFNLDATKIVWRVYHPKTEKEICYYRYLLSQNSIRPMALQIWTMNADGPNKTQTTDNCTANFGPYFFPDGNRIIFSSNLHDPKERDFDLYAINLDGSSLERITYFDGFYGFPMFSPDGNYFVFSSNRNQIKKGDTNLFIVEWRYN